MEIMEGYLNVGNGKEGDDSAIEPVQTVSNSANLCLYIDAWDINASAKLENQAAMVTGTFSCPFLSKHPLRVLKGDFQLRKETVNIENPEKLGYDFEMLSVGFWFVYTDFRRQEIPFNFLGTVSVYQSMTSSSHARINRSPVGVCLRLLVLTTS